MRFIVDECTGPQVARWLERHGHEVFSVYHEARGMSDDQIIGKANTEGWVLITNDKDFGEKVFRERRPHKGVVLLRLMDERAPLKIEVLERFLREYGQTVAGRFAVVTDDRVRFSGAWE